MKPIETGTVLETGEMYSQRPMPKAWAKLLGLDENRTIARHVPPWMRREHIVAAAARVRELQAMVGAEFEVMFLPECVNGDDIDAAGHLFCIHLVPGAEIDEGYLDDRGDVAQQLQTWLLTAAGEFQAAAERVAARRKAG